MKTNTIFWTGTIFGAILCYFLQFSLGGPLGALVGAVGAILSMVIMATSSKILKADKNIPS